MAQPRTMTPAVIRPYSDTCPRPSLAPYRPTSGEGCLSPPTLGSVGALEPGVVAVPNEYVSTACRIGDHNECQLRPIVRCACPCHVLDGPEMPEQSPSDPEERWVPDDLF